jgi:asparagine synthase (glutamine-hydrolysing)
MCGIVGFSGTPDQQKLSAMLGSITHRGPDDEARLETDMCTLGMRRLAIIDLSDNIYPVFNEDGKIKCVYNGEIYNYIALREELKALGHTFKTDSDSEVVVHGYEQWGVEVVTRLRGMFVIALFDENINKLYVMRDRLGIKPLYYTEFQGRVIFASEIKAILSAWDIDRTPDHTAVYRFLLTRIHDDEKRTFFGNIKRLLPAHVMEIEPDGNFRVSKYWEPKVNTSFASTKSDEEYATELRDKFRESMKLHLITDVPLGVTLSGGLDSSSVASVAADLLKEGTDLHTDNQLKTFSAIHPGEKIDESEYIDEVVKFTGAKSIKVEPKVDEFWKEIEQWTYYQEEPTISTAPYAYFTVMREAKKHVKVLLSGQGGDELFAGYIPYFMSYVQTAQDASAFMDIMRESVQGFDLYSNFIEKKLAGRFASEKELSISSVVTVQPELLSEPVLYHKHERNLNSRLKFDLLFGSVPNLLRYEDKNAMANSIESRVPFLDHELVELALQIPASQKIKHGWNRYVYRNAMKGLMPDKNRLRRSKIGFVNSEWEWILAKAINVAQIFNSEQFKSRPYWDGAKVLSEFQASVRGERRGDWLMFWRLLSVELWLRQFVDEFKRPEQFTDAPYDKVLSF